MSTEDDYTLEIDTSIHVSDLEVGDILEFERQLGPFTYFHCGNYAGNNMIIHKGTAPWVDSVQVFHAKWNNDIGYRIDSLQDVARGSKVYRNNMLDDTISPSKEQPMLRAKAMYGEGDYDILYKNCQHFCTKMRLTV
ncbi:phospholipase A and acyltransferase 4-like isoform X2 [Ruditapes philippinarum]|uniref:phospholipase A and acyltransferase 4-like isoform X2 n=1 Tax=Ruditapes philippinarum TaxID=129788 RepID=UPI00295B0847|nr:phospholipase A and acyltransferase 4-like isoform X2 [Ruditapes philippinarum]